MADVEGWVDLHAAVGAAGNYMPGTPYWRIVWHTTETLADPRNWVPNWLYPSQLVADIPTTARAGNRQPAVYQCCPLGQAGKALYNASGGVETNRQYALQVEVNWLAADLANPRPTWTDEDCDWLAVNVLDKLITWSKGQGGFPIDPSVVRGLYRIPGSASDTAAQRMDHTTWNFYRGSADHAVTPENDHWDVGQNNLGGVHTAWYKRFGASAPVGEEDTMLTAFYTDPKAVVGPRAGSGSMYVASEGKCWAVRNETTLQVLRDTGQLKPGYQTVSWPTPGYLIYQGVWEDQPRAAGNPG